MRFASAASARSPDARGTSARQGSLVRYPPLVEEEGVMVAQYEHSLYLGPEGVEVLTA